MGSIVLPGTASGRATSGRWLGLCVLALLAGCATPQEKAITAHCEAEGARIFAQQMATQQVAVPAAAGYGWSASHIDVDSVLRNHAVQTNSPHCPLRARVQARPFATVPYMGRGKGEADLESKLQFGQFVRQGKECGTVSDTFFENQFTPMIPYVAQNVQNPVHLIPEVASAGWVRAGIPSRQWVRDQNC